MTKWYWMEEGMDTYTHLPQYAKAYYEAADVEAWLEAKLKIHTFIGQTNVSGHDVIRRLLKELRGEAPC